MDSSPPDCLEGSLAGFSDHLDVLLQGARSEEDTWCRGSSNKRRLDATTADAAARLQQLGPASKAVADAPAGSQRLLRPEATSGGGSNPSSLDGCSTDCSQSAMDDASAATCMTAVAKSGSDTTSVTHTAGPPLPLKGSLARDSASASTAGPVAPGLASGPAAVESFTCDVKSENESDDLLRLPEEQRRVKRRLANRESAQRVRQKRRLQLEDLQAKVALMTGETQHLVRRIAEAEAARDSAAGQLVDLQARLTAENAAAKKLRAASRASGGASASASVSSAAGSFPSALSRLPAPPPQQPGLDFSTPMQWPRMPAVGAPGLCTTGTFLGAAVLPTYAQPMPPQLQVCNQYCRIVTSGGPPRPPAPVVATTPGLGAATAAALMPLPLMPAVTVDQESPAASASAPASVGPKLWPVAPAGSFPSASPFAAFSGTPFD